jgi:hypothetical protein
MITNKTNFLRKFFFICLLLFVFWVDDINAQTGLAGRASIDMSFGQWQAKNLGYSPINTIGATISWMTVIMNYKSLLFRRNLNLDYFIPVQTRLSNIVTTRQTGFSLGTMIGRNLIPKAKRFDMVLNIGFQSGLLLLQWTNPSLSQNNSLYRHFFFSPVAVIQPRLILGRFSVGVQAGYQYETSAGRWKYSDKSLAPLGNSYITGYILKGVIGLSY